MECLGSEEIVLYVEGQLPVATAEDFEAHLGGCTRCREQHGALIETARYLAAEPGEFEDAGLRDIIQRRAAAGYEAPPHRTIARWLIPFAALAAAGVVVLMLPFQGSDDGFVARTGLVRDADRWVAAKVFHGPTEAGTFEPVTDHIRTADALAFAIKNHPNSAAAYVMIFAVAEDGGVDWYYPAPEGTTDAKSIPVRASADYQELGEAIQYPMRPGMMRIFALFSAEPLRVSAVEAGVARALADETIRETDRLPFDDIGQQSFLVRVE
ncbi:MAG: zf-HC2 domain-containing protein [Deltaproteobacteria bacterium]|nr:zf-HC2 domain-containing protein [Deltaproteobacteria bacterium]